MYGVTYRWSCICVCIYIKGHFYTYEHKEECRRLRFLGLHVRLRRGIWPCQRRSVHEFPYPFFALVLEMANEIQKLSRFYAFFVDFEKLFLHFIGDFKLCVFFEILGRLVKTSMAAWLTNRLGLVTVLIFLVLLADHIGLRKNGVCIYIGLKKRKDN